MPSGRLPDSERATKFITEGPGAPIHGEAVLELVRESVLQTWRLEWPGLGASACVLTVDELHRFGLNKKLGSVIGAFPVKVTIEEIRE